MRPPAETVVQAVDVVRRHRQGDAVVEALRGVSLTVAKGELVAIVGPSGSGKSTLLQILGGLDVPDAGSVVVAGHALHAIDEEARTAVRRRAIGFVFQAFNLVPMLTAVENVALPLLLDGVPTGDARAAAHASLARVGLEGRAMHMPSRLSGGEAQRVAVARALVTGPAVIFADEPTGNLDTRNADLVLELLSRATVLGSAVVLVTHDVVAASRADRSIRLVDGAVVSSREEAMWSPVAS